MNREQAKQMYRSLRAYDELLVHEDFAQYGVCRGGYYASNAEYRAHEIEDVRKNLKRHYASGYNAAVRRARDYFANQARALLSQALRGPVSIADVDAAYAILGRLDFWQNAAHKAALDALLEQAKEHAQDIRDVLADTRPY